VACNLKDVGSHDGLPHTCCKLKGPSFVDSSAFPFYPFYFHISVLVIEVVFLFRLRKNSWAHQKRRMPPENRIGGLWRSHSMGRIQVSGFLSRFSTCH